jgi:putative heme transporter
MSRSRIIKALVRVLLYCGSAWIIIRLLSKVDFAKVWDAIETLSWTEVAVLALLLIVIRTLTAIPLALFVAGLRVPRAVLNDLAGNLLSTVAPPPSDIVIRYSMFDSWGLDLTASVAAVTLNTLLYYAIRFSAPLLGVAILVMGVELQSGRMLTTALSAVVAVIILALLAAVVRGEQAAAAVGRLGGRLGHRVLPAKIDAEQWASKTVEFRGLIGDQLSQTWPLASAALLAMVIADGCVLLFSLRSVGVPADVIGPFLVMGSFLACYPLTALPFAGMGILDAALYELAVGHAGEKYSTSIVAALVIWRTTTVLAPLVAGLAAYLGWRMTNPRALTDTMAEVAA